MYLIAENRECVYHNIIRISPSACFDHGIIDVEAWSRRCGLCGLCGPGDPRDHVDRAIRLRSGCVIAPCVALDACDVDNTNSV